MHTIQMDKFENKKIKNIQYDARIHLLDQKQFKKTVKLQKKMKRDVSTLLMNQREEKRDDEDSYVIDLPNLIE